MPVFDMHGLLRRAGPLCLAFLMVACASQDSSAPLGYDEARAERLFTASYQDVSDIYIEEVSVSDLAIAGMGSLASIDPAIDVEADGTRLRVSVDGRPMASYPLPASNDAQAWGALTAAVISASRYHSSDLENADPERLYEAVFDGLLTQLDSFSRYAGRDAARENRASRDGFGGIGVRIRLIEEGVLVLSVMEDTPAETAGILEDDVIVAIDGSSVEGLDQLDVVNRLRGRTGSEVMLSIERASEMAPLTLAVMRSHIVPQTVSYHRDGNLAYIRLSGFNKSTVDGLRQKIRQAQNEIGGDLRGYILDLRGNPGGLLEQAYWVSDVFVTRGRIVSTHGRHNDSHQYFPAKSDDLTDNAPIVVLIDGGSASAAEIVAAALQDSGRAVLVGSGSYGKGTVQTVLNLPNNGEFILTWARFHAPSGYALHRRGVLPDICTTGDVATSADVMNMIQTGVLPIAADLRRLDIDTNDDAAVEALRTHCPAREDEAEIDMQVARQLLAEPGLYARALHAQPDTAATQLAPAAGSGS
ncbi:S41 family peptidase [Pelagibius sp. 7325]|uniref:S41 family peptidase n=1 Tax=Pelagibius sp. 7325 TaxID=3131994 RepID=UPI0030EC004F